MKFYGFFFGGGGGVGRCLGFVFVFVCDFGG